MVQHLSKRRDIDIDAQTILVVEDRGPVRRAVVRLVQSLAPSAKVFEAEHGRKAIQVLADMKRSFLKEPSLIILDLDLPGMDGWDVLDQLKAAYEKKGRASGIPVIVHSGTTGDRGLPFLGKSVHGKRSPYVPLVTVAKDTCLSKERFDGSGEMELTRWIRHFLQSRHAAPVSGRRGCRG